MPVKFAAAVTTVCEAFLSDYAILSLLSLAEGCLMVHVIKWAPGVRKHFSSRVKGPRPSPT
eukprot:scaffold189976_cov24-Prasinocladus_malaysianus.AAC.2